ncbi:MAG TPA: DNA repair protein RadC [Thermoanaerobaculia bacterium]|nr:DNA repair protein RadC [Thermoanaerobaculia bacterium]
MSETAGVPVSVIQETPAHERPRERFDERGSAALSDAELVALLLRSGDRTRGVIELAQAVIRHGGGLVGLLDARMEELVRLGVGRAKAYSILAAIEIGRRLAKRDLPEREPLARPAAVASYLVLRYRVRDQEVMGALYLDARHRLVAERELFRGTLSRAAVEPREVLKEGLLRGACAVVLFHTHPSGDPSPSLEDLAFTRRMAEAGDAVGIRLVDHLILGGTGRWVSLKERGAW